MTYSNGIYLDAPSPTSTLLNFKNMASLIFISLSFSISTVNSDRLLISIPVSGVESVRIDNRWIVPYNPFLSAKYNCHTNVESVATFRTMKYCFKYIHKGPDRTTLEYKHDKIKHFINGHYIGPPEGV